MNREAGTKYLDVRVALSTKNEAGALLGSRLRANDFVALDDGGNADSRGTIFRFFVDPNHFAHRADEHFRSSGYFGGQSKRQVEFGSRAQILIDCKVNAASGNITCLSAARGYFFVNR